MRSVLGIFLGFLLSTQCFALNYVDQAYLAKIGKNWIKNGGAEQARAGWSTYADTAGTTPVDCTGGSPTATWTVSSTTPISEKNSFIFTHPASNVQGNGAAYAFSVDNSEQARQEQISFDYEIASGTFTAGVVPIGGASAVDSDLEVYVYDVTNGVVIQPSNYRLLQNSGEGRFTGSFQTASNSTSYRLCLHAATTAASSFTLRLDSIKVSPVVVSSGPPATDWVSYTPTFTGFGTVSNVNFVSRRVADSLEITGSFTTGTTTATTAQITMGYNGGNANVTSADTTKIPSIQIGGAMTRADTGGSAGAVFNTLINSNRNYFTFGYNLGGTTGGLTEQNGNALSSAITVAIKVKCPIQGWSSNVAMSSDVDGRVVAMFAQGTPTGTLSAAFNLVTYPTVTTDTHGDYSSGTYTIPTPGYYNVSAQIRVSATFTSSQAISVAVFKNGSEIKQGDVTSTASVTSTFAPSVSVNGVYCNAGDTIQIKSYLSGTAGSFDSNAGYNFFSVSRAPGPAQIAASDTVAARYYASTTTISGSLATISWTTSDFDDHSAMSGGTYTLPISGKYQVNSCVALSAASSAAGNAVDMQLQKNASVVSEVAPVYQGTQVALPVCVSDTIHGLAGDTIRIQVSSGATTPAIAASNSKNFFSIVRVGNY